MKTLIVVPAFNEAATIAQVCADAAPHGDVLVIDDGSHDETGAQAERAGATVVRHVINRGLGAALRTGFRFAIEQGYDAVITIDADGQHDAAQIPLLTGAIAAGGADIAIGTRDRAHMPRIRRAYNAVGALLTSTLFGGPLRDSQSGFRCIQSRALSAFDLQTSRMEISSEIIAEAHRLGLRLCEVPITVRYTEYSMSKGQNLFEGVRTAWRLMLRSFTKV